jgi:hypothetical protein
MIDWLLGHALIVALVIIVIAISMPVRPRKHRKNFD